MAIDNFNRYFTNKPIRLLFLSDTFVFIFTFTKRRFSLKEFSLFFLHTDWKHNKPLKVATTKKNVKKKQKICLDLKIIAQFVFTWKSIKFVFLSSISFSSFLVHHSIACECVAQKRQQRKSLCNVQRQIIWKLYHTNDLYAVILAYEIMNVTANSL